MKPTDSMPSQLLPSEQFASRHIGPDTQEIAAMLATLGFESLDALTDATLPAAIRLRGGLTLEAAGEAEALARLRGLAERNRVFRSFIGMGYHGTLTPAVIQRNILENPGWYTQYTPYQAEIAQGRLEALLNFQTMIADLTALPIANASLLDEATAAAEAMHMACAGGEPGDARKAFYIADHVHPQTIAVVQARAEPLGIPVHVGPAGRADFAAGAYGGVLVQYPDTYGVIHDFAGLADAAHAAGALLVAACDPLALTLLRPPGEWGADIAIGSAQRFGVPMGYGGPHAAFIATREEFKRRLPGRIVGVSVDADGAPALRLALQTREQHIRRERATSNICTAQVLLAIMAAMYAVYHGPEGLRGIARRVHAQARALAGGLRRLGFALHDAPFFDTLLIECDPDEQQRILAAAAERCLNLRVYDDGALGIALDETVTREDLRLLIEAFAMGRAIEFEPELWAETWPETRSQVRTDDKGAAARPPQPHAWPEALNRTSAFLTHPAFNTHHSETAMLRYLTRLQGRDLSLAHSMIPLGSCTMKLNATSEMLPATWPEFAALHPFAPEEQAAGYHELFDDLEQWLGEITGLPAVSLQPNAGSQGEYAGLLAIRAYHRARGEAGRTVVLIPVSAHGTNPASAALAGLRVVAVACDAAGNVDLDDLRAKAEGHAGELAALMVTYPSTHGVFEPGIVEICRIVHAHGGQVYLDGANMNAQVGLCRPGDYGADVCHLNLHKTFCIPHGGGGPGMGPIAVAEHLAAFLPGHPLPGQSDQPAIGPVAAAPFGSAGILAIPWMYIAMMGAAGLRRATQVAILNANYMAARLEPHYPILFRGATGRVAHEFIIDARPFKKQAGIEVEDIAKRLIDYGFHAPTMSFPVPGTLMIEPTESEDKAELDRFCDALIAIRAEIEAIADGRADRADNPLKHAPHTIARVSADAWPHAYTRAQAAWPAPWLHDHKFWPAVARVDNAYGDRNLICTCPPMLDLPSEPE